MKNSRLPKIFARTFLVTQWVVGTPFTVHGIGDRIPITDHDLCGGAAPFAEADRLQHTVRHGHSVRKGGPELPLGEHSDGAVRRVVLFQTEVHVHHGEAYSYRIAQYAGIA